MLYRSDVRVQWNIIGCKKLKFIYMKIFNNKKKNVKQK